MLQSGGLAWFASGLLHPSFLGAKNNAGVSAESLLPPINVQNTYSLYPTLARLELEPLMAKRLPRHKQADQPQQSISSPGGSYSQHKFFVNDCELLTKMPHR
jgi:hypothetical protein